MKNKPFLLTDLQQSACAHRNPHIAKPVAPEKKPKQNKFRNQKVEFDGFEFDSIKERDRYILNRHRQGVGEIKELTLQVTFLLESNDEKVCDYRADFVYTIVKTGELVVEDVKSSATRRLAVYRLKKKLMMAQHGIEIKEI